MSGHTGTLNFVGTPVVAAGGLIPPLGHWTNRGSSPGAGLLVSSYGRRRGEPIRCGDLQPYMNPEMPEKKRYDFRDRAADVARSSHDTTADVRMHAGWVDMVRLVLKTLFVRLSVLESSFVILSVHDAGAASSARRMIKCGSGTRERTKNVFRAERTITT